MFQCAACGCRDENKKYFHKHHILYKPAFMTILCIRCHKEITRINTAKRAIKNNHPLTCNERVLIYSHFLDTKAGSHDWLFLGSERKNKKRINKEKRKRKRLNVEASKKAVSAYVKKRFGRKALYGVWDNETAKPSAVKIIKP